MTKLVVVDQKEVDFYGDELTAVKGEDGRVYVSIRRMCDALGVDRRGQMRRIRDNEVLAEGYTRGGVTSPPDPEKGGGGTQQAALLRVDLVPLWLAGISPNRVSEEVRAKLVRFQKEAAAVLWEAFQDGRLTVDPSFNDLLQQASPELVDAYQMAQALVKLAQNQIMLEARLDKHTAVLDDHTRRLETIEADLHHPERYITETQATQISQAIRSIALVMSKRSQRNEYGATWGEFYRRFDVAKYRHLPAARFDEAINWLSNWYKDLTGDEPF